MKKEVSNLLLVVLTAIIIASTNQFSDAQDLSDKENKQTTSNVILANTPPLGFNSFDSYGINIYEEVAMNEIDAFIEKFAPHGYEYFVIDNGWFASPKSQMFKGYLVPVADKTNPTEVTVNEYGIPVPCKQYFPNGLKPLIDKLHSTG